MLIELIELLIKEIPDLETRCLLTVKLWHIQKMQAYMAREITELEEELSKHTITVGRLEELKKRIKQ